MKITYEFCKLIIKCCQSLVPLSSSSSDLCDAERAVLFALHHPFLQTDPVEVMSAVGNESVRMIHVLQADTADITVFSQLSLASRGQGPSSLPLALFFS